MAKAKFKWDFNMIILAAAIVVVGYLFLSQGDGFSLVLPTPSDILPDDIFPPADDFPPAEDGGEMTLDERCTYICGPQMVEGGNTPYDYGRFNADEVCLEPAL